MFDVLTSLLMLSNLSLELIVVHYCEINNFHTIHRFLDEIYYIPVDNPGQW